MDLSRRKVILGVLAFAALLEAALAFAVLRGDGDQTLVALPLHPVAGSFKADSTELDECSEQACFEQAFGNIAYYDGPRTAMSQFDEVIAEGDPSCHRIAHAIGAASLVRYRGNVARTFAEGSSSCFSGYYHGVLERALVNVRTNDPDRLGRVARGLCDDPDVLVSRWLAYQCFHGLGHGLMITTGYGLPTSLDACERIETYLDRTSCKGGVFMENISSSYGVTSQWIRADDPVYPCNAVDQNDKITCYGMVTSRILRVDGLDWENAAEICAEVETNFVKTCFRSLGRDISGQTHRDPAEIVELCAVTHPYDAEKDCISAAAMDMTSNYTSGTQAAVLCETAEIALRGECYYSIGAVMGRFTDDAARQEDDCKAITASSEYVVRCLEGTKIRGPLSVALAR
ncbi:MAG: hypothetical protein H0U05_04450 [Actinobacteria bacterium]|nr:hypothetical protein [Actinomycetota bacterium]